MGETLTSGSEAALVNRLRGRGRPRKTQPQKPDEDCLHSIQEEDNLDNEKLTGETIMSNEEECEYEPSGIYSVGGSPLPPTPPLESSGTSNLSSSTPKRTNTSRRDLSLEVPPGMDFILSYMKSLHEKTESTVMKMVDTSKREINHNLDAKVTSLASDLQGIKADVYKIESAVEGKLQKIQEDHRDLYKKVEETNKEIKRVEQVQRAEKTGTKAKIRNLEQDASNDREQHQKEMDALRAEMKEMIQGNKLLIKKYEDTLQDCKQELAESKKEIQEQRTELQLNLDEVKMTAYRNKEDIRQNTLQIEGLENRARSSNLIVEGLPEDESKSLTEQIGDTIRMQLQDFKDSKIKSAYRVGKASSKKKKPRLAIAVMESSGEKETILAKAVEIRKKSGNQNLWFNRDQTDSSKRKHRMVKACYKKLIENDLQCSIKGSVITYQQKQYDYQMLSLLPDGCRPEDIKTRETKDGKGLAFQSDYVYLSNMAPATFNYNKCLYTSAEQAYQTTKMRALGFIQLAQEMQLMYNPY